MVSLPLRSSTEPQLPSNVAALLAAPPSPKAASPLSSPADFSPETSDWGSVFGDDSLPVFDMSELALSDLPEETAVLSLAPQKKRGRKPSRPFDPVHKKTEEKDKFWLRAFRAYMKTHYPKIRKGLNSQERFFWRDYLGPEGQPVKGNRFSSYGRLYKTHLFGEDSFVQQFQDWFLAFGDAVLSKKCARLSPMWLVFYDYGSKDLFNFNPSSPSPPQDSGSVSPETRATPEPDEPTGREGYDIEMVEGDLELLLEEI